MKWISVEDQNPSTGTQILATDGEDMWVLEYYKWQPEKGWWRVTSNCGCCTRSCFETFTHWKPLPQLPEVNDE